MASKPPGMRSPNPWTLPLLKFEIRYPLATIYLGFIGIAYKGIKMLVLLEFLRRSHTVVARNERGRRHT